MHVNKQKFQTKLTKFLKLSQSALLMDDVNNMQPEKL